MNPGPAPRPPTDRPRLGLMPSTINVPGNMSQTSLHSPSIRSTATYNNGEMMTPSLSRTTTLSDGYGSGGVAILKEGPAKVKDGILWKNRYLILRAFQLDFQKGQDGKVSSTIQLKDVTSVSRSETTPLSFEISRVANSGSSASATRDGPQKTIICQLKTDDEIYDWIDVIYNRCPGMGGVSNPTNFSHRVHVGFDPVNGSFVGLPTEWERLLTASAITKEDYQKHPQAVIEVLEFYSDITKRNENPEAYSSLTPTPPATQMVNKQLCYGGGGTGIAPPRPSPPTNAGSQPNFGPQSRAMHDSRPHNGTPVSGQRSASGSDRSGRSTDANVSKIGMDQDMRRAMEEEARRVRQMKEQRERDRVAEDDEHNRRENAAFDSQIPKSRPPMAKQEVSGYGANSDADPSPSRYNPTRNPPPAPGTDRSRQPPQGSLRHVPTQRSPPVASSGTNGNIQPRAPYSQGQSSSGERSPTSAQSSLRTPQKVDQQSRQPSPSTRPAGNGTQQTRSPSSRTRTPQANGSSNPPPSRLPAPVQPASTSSIPIRQPAGPTAATNGNPPSSANQPKLAMSKGPGTTRQKEVRMSSMTESQVMEKLKQVVSKDDPQLSYSKQRKIGQGASGSVYVARVNENAVSPVAKRLYAQHGGKANVAIKQMDLRNQPRKELIVNEIIVMKESSHPNIVNFLDSFLQEGNNELWVVMEYMEGGALTDVIDNNSHITEAQISTICNEVNSMTPALLFTIY